LSITQRINIKGKTCRTYRARFTRDTVGARVQKFQMGASFKAYVASRGEAESFVGDRQQAVSTVTLYVEGGTDIKVTDRVEIESRMYEVTGVRTPGHRDKGDRLFYHIVDAQSNEGV
tara:strand:- start:2324 stop:2674 length:351 start_codon:yes stop_codon:yes gene_type:complete